MPPAQKPPSMAQGPPVDRPASGCPTVAVTAKPPPLLDPPPPSTVYQSMAKAPPAGASLDAPLHLAVYAARPDAMAVLHSHGPHSIAMTLDGEDFVPADFEGRYYFPVVPVLDIPHELYTARSPEEVAAALATHRVCVVRGHGVYAAAESLDLAYKWTCSLESSARIAWLARTADIDTGRAR